MSGSTFDPRTAGNGTTMISRRENAAEFVKLANWISTHTPKLTTTYGVGNIDNRQRILNTSARILTAIQ